MTDKPSAVSGTLRRPFREQVAFFRGKLGKLVPTARWDDISREAHDTAFMVAGAQKADLLADLAAAVDRAIAEGKSLDAFRKDFDAAVARNGWHGWTGEDSKAGRAWRTRTIYRTNANVAYSAGRRAQLEAAGWPLWVYLHGGSRDPRPEHLHVFNGLVLPPDHPFWQKHYPPSDWGCSCYVVGARSERGARRLGGDPSKTLPDGWDAIDAKTGEPMGVGKGWGYAPGASVAGPVDAMTRKAKGWQYQIAKAFMRDLPPDIADDFAQAYRRLPSLATDTRLFAERMATAPEQAGGERRTLGMLTSDQAKAVTAQLKQNIGQVDWSLTQASVLHIIANHGNPKVESNRGQRAVVSQDYERLPLLVSQPDSIVSDGNTALGEPAIRLTRRFGNETVVAVFAYWPKRATLSLRTMYVRG